MNNNVLKDFPYTWKYYLIRPWKLFREIHINLKYAWQRATRGYTDSDVWNMDLWIISVFPNMLRQMADKGMAYPGRPPFETSDKWHAWLHKTADKIESLNTESWGIEEYDSKTEETEQTAKEVFAEIGEHFYCLWD